MEDAKNVFDSEVGTRAMVEPAGVGESFTSEFLGWERGRFVMLRLPTKLAATENLHPDKPVVVKYLHAGGKVCAFRSTVLALAHSPFRILFLRYPEGVEVVSLRKEDRVDCHAPVVLHAESDRWSGVMVNLSTAGCRIVLNLSAGGHLPKTDGIVRLDFRLLGQELEEFRMPARIIKAAVEHGRAVLVVAFQNTPAPDLMRIGRFVEEVLAYRDEGHAP